MRTEKEMLDMILETANADARIRAVTMEGSRANPNAVHDEYSDFDITFFVTDVREFTRDKEWIHRLGDILIVQCPTDWYSHPYDYSSRDPFAFLIQFADGNRIDLTLRDVGLISGEAENKEPRIVLLNKDHFPSLLTIGSEEAFFFSRPEKWSFTIPATNSAGCVCMWPRECAGRSCTTPSMPTMCWLCPCFLRC